MNLTNINAEIIPQDEGIYGMYQMIQKAALTCYQNKVSKKSSKDMVEYLIKHDHLRPLEFGTVYMIIPIYHIGAFYRWSKLLPNNIWCKGKLVNGKLYITTNFRLVVENNLQEDYFKFHCDIPTSYHYLRVCIKIICPRHTGDDFRTHISLSSVMESTRYCNYSQGKFGKEVTFIDNQNCSTEQGEITWRKGLLQSEKNYLAMLKAGETPQTASSVLSLYVKSELWLCGFIDIPNTGWDRFFKMRCSQHARPEAQLLAYQIKQLLYERD